MKTMLNRFDFTHYTVVCLMARIVFTGMANAPVFTAIVLGVYVTGLISKLLMTKFGQVDSHNGQATKGFQS